MVWRWAEPSQGPACRPPILTLLWMTASIKCQPTQPHRHDTLEMAESALQIPGVKGYWVEVGGRGVRDALRLSQVLWVERQILCRAHAGPTVP